jgi:hypothetical protein
MPYTDGDRGCGHLRPHCADSEWNLEGFKPNAK